MRKLTVLLAFAIVAALPVLALAAVNNTQHDIDAYTGPGGYSGTPPTSTGGTCSYCHIPHKAVGARLWPSAGVTGTGNWLGSSNKTTPALCNSCHNTSGTNAYVSARTLRPFESTSHAATQSVMTGWGDSAIPGGTRLDNASDLECTSCHDVHTNTYRPFLAHTATVDLYENCAFCHNNRPNNTPVLGTANNIATLGSQHPTNSTTADVSAHMNFMATIDNAFTVAVAASPGIATSTSWGLGGHLTAANTVRCQTCHAVHGTEGAAAPTNLTTILNETVATAALCEGCHGDSTTNHNPSFSPTAGTHPVDTLKTNWQTTVADLVPPASQWSWGDNAGTRTIICSSCHDMHFASTGSSLFRRAGATTNQNATSLSTYGLFCAACHTAASATTWTHHPVGSVVPGTDLASTPIYASTAVNWTARTSTLGTATYPLDNNVMSCATCHSAGNATAHNIVGTFPGLTGIDNESQMCVDCHSFNPSTYMMAAPRNRSNGGANTMTHYVGNIVTSSYKKTGNFGSGYVGATPKYAVAGTYGSIICESCHALKKDAAYGASALKRWSNNVGTSPTKLATVADNVSLLVAISGNANAATNANDYMCSACHGPSPGGGSTHPVLPVMSVVSSTNITTVVTGAANTGIAGGYATLNNATDLRVNCESCHRPHNATGGTGAIILESQTTTPASNKPAFSLVTDNATYLDQSGLCTRCHSR